MSRDIGLVGTAARGVIGAALLVLGVMSFSGWWDLLGAAIGLPLLAVAVAAALTRVLRSGFVHRGGGLGWSAGEAAASLAVGVLVLLIGTALTFVTPLSGVSLYLFFGGSMVVAAVLGYGGCEVLAVPNLVLRRRDSVWCVLYSPFDQLEQRRPTDVSGRSGP